MPQLNPPPITDEEEARIQAGIASDPDNPEITPEQFAQARPFAEASPERAGLSAGRVGRRRLRRSSW